MNAKTYEILCMLMWASDYFTRPGYRTFQQSFEGWAYSNGMLRQLQRLQDRSILELEDSPLNERVLRLSESGRRLIVGGRDPEFWWGRAWDGNWRLVMFDIAVGHNAHREKVRRYLKGNGFGLLQRSVWVTPDPLLAENELLRPAEVEIQTLLLLQGQPCCGENDNDVVSSAWNFEKISNRYQEYLDVVAGIPEKDSSDSKSWLNWMASESRSWLSAVSLDPLLPARLLPSNYLGQKAWKVKKQVMKRKGAELARRGRLEGGRRKHRLPL